MTANIEKLLEKVKAGEKVSERLISDCERDLRRLDKVLDAIDSMPFCVSDFIEDEEES